MRIALLADMHGNAVAFRAALADLEDRGADVIVSLGDVAQGGPQPFEPGSEYAIVTSDLTVEFRRIPFDLEELVAAARLTDFPDITRWAALWKR